MSIALPTAILNLRGQVVKGINFDPHIHCLTLRCRRDKRIKAIDSVTGQSGTINRCHCENIKRVFATMPSIH